MALARIAGVSSVNGKTGVVTLTAADIPGVGGGGGTPDVAVILASDHGTLDPTGATDNAPIMRSCYTTALAALASGSKSTEIVWPAGTFKMSTAGTGTISAGGAALVLRSDTGGHTGQVKLRGQGVSATKFKMNTTCAGLVANYAGDTVGSTFGNLVLEGFTVDHQSINVAGRPCALLNIYTGTGINIDRVTVQDVNVINMLAPNFNTVVTGLALDPGDATVWNSGPRYTCSNVYISRCKFLGGSYGIIIQAYNGIANTAAAHDSDILAGGFITNAFFDNINIEKFEWDSQVANFAAAPLQYDSAGIMTGDKGVIGKMRITDCTVRGSYDVGYEVDSTFDTILTRCVAEDSYTSGFYHRSGFGGFPDVGGPAGSGPALGRANYSLVDCSVRLNKLVSVAQGAPDAANQPVPQGFAFSAFDNGLAAGSVTVRNFSYVADGPRAFYAYGPVNSVEGAFRSADLEGIRVSMINVAANHNYGFESNGLFVGMHPGRGALRLHDYTYTVEGSSSVDQNFLAINALSLAAFGDHHVDIDGVYSKVNLTGSTPSYTEILLYSRGSNVDNFASSTNFLRGWRNDLTGSGQSTANFTVASNTLTVTSPGTTEYRLTQVTNENDQARGVNGPATDQNTWIEATKPTTPTSNYKQGVRLKVGALTPTNSVHCYVDYTGTNYRIRIDTEVAGVLTNRASTTIGAAVSAPFWVRGKIIDGVVTAEYLTSVPTSAVGPAPAFSSTYTVSSGDGTLALFGSQGPQGYPGLVWKPIDSGSTTKAYTNYEMSVLGGRISRVSPLGIVGTTNNCLIRGQTGPIADQWRMRRTLELPEWDTTGFASAPNYTQIHSTVDAVTLSKMRASRWRHFSPPAAAAITVTGSPFTYTNADWYDEDVAIYSGTVSVVSVTRLGASASQVAAATGAVVRLAPGESVTVTYSVAPTMRATPVT